MKKKSESFVKKNGLKTLILTAVFLLGVNAIYSIIERDPIPQDWEWCEDCRAYKPPGHNKNKID